MHDIVQLTPLTLTSLGVIAVLLWRRLKSDIMESNPAGQRQVLGSRSASYSGTTVVVGERARSLKHKTGDMETGQTEGRLASGSWVMDALLQHVYSSFERGMAVNLITNTFNN
jgi:hypothetical protein